MQEKYNALLAALGEKQEAEDQVDEALTPQQLGRPEQALVQLQRELQSYAKMVGNYAGKTGSMDPAFLRSLLGEVNKHLKPLQELLNRGLPDAMRLTKKEWKYPFKWKGM